MDLADLKRMSSRELMAAARSASRGAELVALRIAAMSEAEGVRGGGMTGSTGGRAGDASGMGRTDARIDYEASALPRLREDYATIDYARSVLYGRDGRGGIAALYHGEPGVTDGTLVADLICCHYLGWRYCLSPRPDLSSGAGIMSWADAAEDVGMSLRSAHRHAQAALDLIDMHGHEAAAEGVA